MINKRKRMKMMKVPLYPVIEYLDLTSVQKVIETKTERTYMDVANWKEFPYKPIAVVDVARTREALYISFYNKGMSLKAQHTTDGSPVHKDSCVEFFMKTVDSPTYINFEFNCIGVCNAAHRLSREESTPFTPKEYATIERCTSIPPAKRDGSLNEKENLAWNLLVKIPFTTMGLDPDFLPEKIMVNFYKCADGTKYPHFLSWSPIDLPNPDFHCPQFFGELYL